MYNLDPEADIWAFVERHLTSIYSRDVATYRATTADDLSLYEWFVTTHRQDGLDFHLFMIDHAWHGIEGDYRFDLLERRLQRYGNTAIVSYTLMLTTAESYGGIRHALHNESRVLVRDDEGGPWRVVHVHKSPAWPAPREQGGDPTPF